MQIITAWRLKCLLTMKLLILFTIIACVQASARGYGQTVSLSLQNAPLEKAFKEIKRQTGYSFVYTRAQLKNTIPITYQVANGSLKDVLEQCFRNQPLSFVIEDKYIVVQTKAAAIPPPTTQQPPITVAGKVINEDGEIVAGATVIAKKSNKATSTNERGEFLLKDVDENETLLITSIGYYKEEIEVDKRTYLLIRLRVAVGTLDETVVMAYGKISKRLNTGNIGKVTSEEIAKQPVTDPLATLHGKVSGLVITQTSGLPGSTIKVQIRGQNSLTQGSEPLFVIDGVPFAANNQSVNNLTSILTSGTGIGLSPFSTINPSDIESIEILKDADATAIYGSRGANGVILITTKKGKSGKTKVTANFYSGWSNVTRTMDMLATPDYLRMRREAFVNDGLIPSSDPTSMGFAPDLLLWDTTRNTDFKKLMIGSTANTFSAQTGISGGNQNVQFLLNSGYIREGTVFPGDMGLSRISLSNSINYTGDKKKFSIKFTGNYSYTKNNLINASVYSFLILPPNSPSLYTSDGKLNWDEGGVNFDNPLSYLLRKYSAITDNFLGNLQVDYKIFRGLSLRTSLGYNMMQVDEKSINPIAAQNPSNNPNGTLSIGNSNLKSWIIEPQVEYERNIGKGVLSILLGTTFQENINKRLFIEASGYVNDNLLSSLAGGTISSKSNRFSDYKYSAFFGRLNYNLAQKYIFNITGRRDGSSRFGPGRQFANFGAFGAGWLFYKERLVVKKLPFISYGKLRSSYGITGNDQIGDYSFLDTWNINSNSYQGSQTLNPSGLFNADYGWEVNRKFELGFELGFLRDRILFSSSFYDNRSDNQLVSYKLPGQTGFPSITRNFPALIQNKGFEFELTVQPLEKQQLNWTISFNLSLPKNRLLSFPSLSTSSYSSTYVEGNSLNLIFQLKSLGANPNTGIFDFEDINNDSIIKIPDDLKVSGNTDPVYYGGFRNNIRYKDFEFDFFVEFKKQTGRNYLYSIYGNNFLPGFMGNQPAIVLDRWQKQGDLSPIQKFTVVSTSAAYSARNNFRSSDGVYSDASFLRFKTVSVSWHLPKSLLEKLKFSNFRLYVTGQNLFTITNYKGSDPEVQNLYVLPPLRTLAAGIQVTF